MSKLVPGSTEQARVVHSTVKTIYHLTLSLTQWQRKATSTGAYIPSDCEVANAHTINQISQCAQGGRMPDGLCSHLGCRRCPVASFNEIWRRAI